MEQAVQDFIQNKRIAIVGVSHDTKKFGNAIYTELKKRGYQVFGVNASMNELEGEPVYPSLVALKGKIDGAVVCVKPSKGLEVLLDASKAEIKNIWLQQGAESPEVLKAGKELGLNLISKKCILMYAPPVQSMHGVHRFVMKVFGQL